MTFGLALVPAGRLGDMLGRRRMFLIALAAFVVTSALTGAAPTSGLLVAARLVQGLAGGMLAPQNSGLIQQLFQGAERGRAFGILGATIGLATAAGPVVGGLILAVFTGPVAWRWVFYVNVPIGLVALVLAARLLPRTPAGAARQRQHLDFIGACGQDRPSWERSRWRRSWPGSESSSASTCMSMTRRLACVPLHGRATTRRDCPM